MTTLLKTFAVCLILASAGAKPPADKGVKGQGKKADQLARLAERLGDRTPQSVLDFLKSLQETIPHIAHNTTTAPTTTPAAPAAVAAETTTPAAAVEEAPQARREFRAQVKASPSSQAFEERKLATLRKLVETLQKVIQHTPNPPPGLLSSLADLQLLLQGTTSTTSPPVVEPAAAAEETTTAAPAAEPPVAPVELPAAADTNDVTTEAPAPEAAAPETSTTTLAPAEPAFVDVAEETTAAPVKRQYHENSRGSRGRRPAWYWRLVITLQRLKSVLQDLLAEIPDGNAYLAVQAAVDALESAIPFVSEEAAANPLLWAHPRYAQGYHEGAGVYTTTTTTTAAPTQSYEAAPQR